MIYRFTRFVVANPNYYLGNKRYILIRSDYANKIFHPDAEQRAIYKLPAVVSAADLNARGFTMGGRVNRNYLCYVVQDYYN